MTNSQFQIQRTSFSANPRPDVASGFMTQSVPRAYQLTFIHDQEPGSVLVREMKAQKAPLLLVDKRIHELYLSSINEIEGVPTFVVDSSESVKEIGTVLEIIEFMERNNATKSSMVFAVGGGIVQDLAAFSCAMYKRGLPWVFMPTTLLAQGDSCVGGKSALNHKSTKNLLALFSAPRRVIINTQFLRTLPSDDILSGAGEIFRLCITGGGAFLDVFNSELPAFLLNDAGATSRLIATALSVKRAVVEFDEFELDIRRSMNYGHSFGHALEALSNYQIPHGIGVTIGILVENQISFQRGMFAERERELMVELGRQIIPEDAKRAFRDTSLDGILGLFRRDKKTEGTILKMAGLAGIGDMRFIDFPLDKDGETELRQAVQTVLSSL